MYIKIARTRDVDMPQRGHAHDAGLDFFMPYIDCDFIRDFQSLKQNQGVEINPEKIILQPGQAALIPSGIHIEIPIGHAGIFQNKSGVATKKRLLVGAQVIDTFYNGESHIHLVNVSDTLVVITPGEKLTQLIIVPVVAAIPIEGSLDSFYENQQEQEYRGNAGFGSTGLFAAVSSRQEVG
jgi:dUTP pyrophosphatase